MKKIIFIFPILLITILASGQEDFLTKKDFQSEKTKLNDQIKATGAYNFVIRDLVEKQNTKIDSLMLINAENDLQYIGLSNEVKGNTDNIGKINNQLNNCEKRTKQNFIYIIAIICATFLVSLILFLLLWKKLAKKTSSLEQDIEKINEAVNLHIKTVAEEISTINEALNNLKTDTQGKINSLNDSTEKNIQAIAADLRHAGLQTDDKMQALRNDMDNNIKNIESKLNNQITSINEIMSSRFEDCLDKHKRTGETIDNIEQTNNKIINDLKKQIEVLSAQIEKHQKNHK